MDGDEYRRIRERLGLTQAELAARLGVRPNSVWRREAGRVRITREAELAIRGLAERAAGA